MIAFKYDNCLIPKQKIFSTAKKLIPEIKKLPSYECVSLLDDDKQLHVIEAAIALKKRYNHQLIIVVGIGGSNLGTMAVQEALLGKQWNLNNTPKIMYADTVDTD